MTVIIWWQNPHSGSPRLEQWALSTPRLSDMLCIEEEHFRKESACERVDWTEKSCEDLDRHCIIRAYQRQCETNADFMTANCPESCGKCDDSGGPHDVAMQESIIKIVSEYGVIRIRLRPDWEKDLVADILGLFLDIRTAKALRVWSFLSKSAASDDNDNASFFFGESADILND